MSPIQPGAHDSGQAMELTIGNEAFRRTIANYQRNMAEVLLDMACLEGLDNLPTTLSLPRQFMVMMQKMVDLYDESTRFFLGSLRRRGHSAECKTGCTYCCQNMPAGISAVELLHIYQGMHKTGKFPQLFRRCLEAQEIFTEVYRKCRHCAEVSGPFGSLLGIALKQYHGLGHPCPFLFEGLCRIYTFRPFACRMHHSLSPSYWCNPEHFQFAHAIKFNLEPADCVYDALDHLDGRLGLNLSEVLVTGLLELAVNVFEFRPITWT